MFIYGAIVIFVAVVNGYPQSGSNRIISGEEVEIEKVPYQVSIHGSKYRMCGGSILSTEWILTSARCAKGGGYARTIRAGSSMLYQGGTEHQSVKIIAHEDYQIDLFGMPKNDIALIKIEPPMEFDQTHQAVKLVDVNEQFQSNASTIVTGWGTTGSENLAKKLQMVRVPFLALLDCLKYYIQFGGLPGGQICTYDPSGKGPCDGDYGGPMMIEGRQAGIVLGGKGCEQSRYPAVYTEIASYRDWIRSHANV